MRYKSFLSEITLPQINTLIEKTIKKRNKKNHPAIGYNRMLIISDAPVQNVIVKTLSKKLSLNVIVFNIRPSAMIKAGRFRRHLLYMLYAIKTLSKVRRVKYLFFFQQAIAYYYSFFSIFLSSPHTQTLVAPVIYRIRQQPIELIYQKIFRYFLRSPYVNKFVSFSSRDISQLLETFGQDLSNKLFYIPLGINMPLTKIEKRPFQNLAQHKKISTGYYLSLGSSNRDYITLIKAFRELDQRVKILCPLRLINMITLPKNVEVYQGLYSKKATELIKSAKAIIIPLKRSPFPSGQLTAIQAMRMGKPIIVTRHTGIYNYLADDCCIFVEPESPEEIIRAVNQIEKVNGLSKRIALKAQQKYERNFTSEHFALRLANLLQA